MVQGELLTAHTGGEHVGKGASGDQLSLRQGAETGTSTDLDPGIATMVEQCRKCEKEVLPKDFRNERDK